MNIIGYAIINYFMVDCVKSRYPQLEVNKGLYVLGALSGNALLTWIYLIGKVNFHNKLWKL